MIAFRKATKGMLCDDIYIHMWNLIRKEFEEYERIPPTIMDEIHGVVLWKKDNERHRLFDLPSGIIKNHSMTWHIDGKYHREWDLPALIAFDADGGYRTLGWYKNDKFHRDTDEPSDIRYEYSYWYKNGEIHREGDKPAIVSTDGDMWWLQNSKLYREGNKPTIVKHDGTMIWAYSDYYWWLPRVKRSPQWQGHRNFQIDPDGTMRWFINNKPGRENDEPAVIYPNGTQVWYGYTNVIHRDGGKPAIVCKDGSKSWFEKGKRIAYFKHGKMHGTPPTPSSQ
jgi:hypothetical protein